MSAAAHLAAALGARRRGRNWRCDCPLGCGYALSLTDGTDGALLAHCFGGCAFDEIWDVLVQYALNDGAFALIESKPQPAEDLTLKIETARTLYDSCAPAAGTLLEPYLHGARGISHPIPEVLRFGPSFPHRLGVRLPAMVAPIVDRDGVQTGVHATYLRRDGSGKADLPKEFQRETRGVVRGGTIRLAPHNPTRELTVAEGIETTLSAMQIFGLPGWSAVSAEGLRALDPPPAVRRLLLAADHDRSGCSERNALAGYDRLSAEGRSVRICRPPAVGDDFNDFLRGRQ